VQGRERSKTRQRFEATRARERLKGRARSATPKGDSQRVEVFALRAKTVTAKGRHVRASSHLKNQKGHPAEGVLFGFEMAGLTHNERLPLLTA